MLNDVNDVKTVNDAKMSFILHKQPSESHFCGDAHKSWNTQKNPEMDTEAAPSSSVSPLNYPSVDP